MYEIFNGENNMPDTDTDTGIVVGSRVRVTSNRAMGSVRHDLAIGMMGTVRVDTGYRYGVELDAPYYTGHNLAGHNLVGILTGVAANRGLWFSTTGELELIGAIAETEANITIPTIPTIPAPIRRMRVRIEHTYSNLWLLDIENGPTDWESERADVLRPYIPREFARRIVVSTWRKYIGRFVDICISVHGIQPDLLVTAITQWALAKMARDGQGVFQSEVDVNEQNNSLTEAITSAPALMAIGNMLYSLTPQGAIKGSRGMALIRKRIVERSKLEAAAMKQAATVEARGIIDNAEVRLGEIREQIARESSSANMRLPEWVTANRVPVMTTGRTDYPWNIGFSVNVLIERFSKPHTRADGVECTYYWNVSEDKQDTTTTILLWVPINLTTGAFKYNGTSDGCRFIGTRKLPHITANGCCMILQGMPEICDNFRKLEVIKGIINRGIRVVNLGSLLASNFNKWHWSIQDQTPDVIKQYLLTQGTEPTIAMYAAASDIVPIDREATETFNTAILEGAIRNAEDRARTATTLVGTGDI